MSIKAFVRDSVTSLLGRPLAESSTARHFFEKISAEAQQELDAKRAAAHEAYASASAQLERVELAHISVRAQAEAAIERAVLLVAQAREAYRQVDAAHQRAITPLENDIQRARRILCELGSPAIEEFTRTLRALIGQTHDSRTVITEPRLDGSAPIVWTNDRSIAARVLAIRHAIDHAEAMMLLGLSEADVTARCEDLLTSLPALEAPPAKYRTGALAHA